MPDSTHNNPQIPNLSIDLRQAICALAEALSLVGVDEKQHGERVAYMGVEVASVLGWDKPRINDLFHAGLLHDCGVSSTKIHTKLVTELDWSGAAAHCHLGEKLLSEFRPLAHLAPAIRYHHTHWDQLQQTSIDEPTALMSNLIYLVDRVDALLAQFQMGGHKSPYQQVRNTIHRLENQFFAPSLVEAFMDASHSEAFWLNLEPLSLVEYIYGMPVKCQEKITEYGDLHTLAGIFARIVDAKSQFTFEHSVGVAELSKLLAGLRGLPPERIAMIEIAALLHDLGKLGVPDEILDKPSRLDEDETLIMHRHSYDTYRILRQINGLEEIAEWAGNHHETLLGDGYPFQHNGNELPVEARVIIVADIFQALAQDRPYRASLPANKILAIISEMASEGKLDKDIVEIAGANLDACWMAATYRPDQPLS